MYVYTQFIDKRPYKRLKNLLQCGNTCHSLVCSVFEAPTLEGVPHSVRVSRNRGRVWCAVVASRHSTLVRCLNMH